MTVPRTPPGLQTRGRKLWRDLWKQHEFEVGEAEVVLEACRTADRLERLNEICETAEPVIETDKGGVITHPAFGEIRQQANLLKMLITALRLPDEQSGKRPQYRGPRGAQKPSQAGTVTALDRARKAAGG